MNVNGNDISIEIGASTNSAIQDFNKLLGAFGKVKTAFSKGLKNPIEEVKVEVDAARLERQLNSIDTSIDRTKKKIDIFRNALKYVGDGTDASGIKKSLAEQEYILSKLEDQRLAAFNGNNKLKVDSSDVDQATAKVSKLQKVVAAFKRIAFYRTIRTAIKYITDGFKVGLENAYYFSKTVDGPLSKSLDSLSSAGFKMKNQLGAAFGQLIVAVTPILLKLVEIITVAANAVTQFFAVVSGQTTYKKATDYWKEWGDAASNAGGKAKAALRYLAPFDELNVLPSERSGGRGSGDSGLDYDKMFKVTEVSDWAKKLRGPVDWIKKNFDSILKVAKSIGAAILLWKVTKKFSDILSTLRGLFNKHALSSGIVLTVTGLILEWDAIRDSIKNGLNAKNFSQLIFGALFTTAGATLIGKRFGKWMVGAILGGAVASVGVIISGIQSALNNGFNDLNAVAITGGFTGLGASIGAAIGMLGGPIGAGVGALIGLAGGAIASAVVKIKADYNEAIRNLLDSSELYQGIQENIRKIEEQSSKTKDLRLRIGSITAEVDENTLINLGAAQNLINEIFDIDAKENKTGAELDALKQKIEVLNGLGLPGIKLEFDETTKKVIGTKEAIQETIESLKTQYKLEALRSAYIEAYKAQFEAQENLTESAENNRKAQEDLKKAQDELTAAQYRYEDAVTSFNAFDASGAGAYSDEYRKLTEAVNGASLAFDAAKETAGAAAWAAYQAGKDLKDSQLNLEDVGKVLGKLDQKYLDIVKTAEKSGADSVKGFVDNAQRAADGSNLSIDVKANLSTFTNSLGTPTINVKAKITDAFSADGKTKVQLNADGGVFANNKWNPITAYANGGSPMGGELFIAREAGPELVGRMGNHTAVMNNDQIVASVSNGVARANEDVVNAIFAVSAQIISAMSRGGRDGGDLSGFAKYVTRWQSENAMANGI